MLGGFVHGGYAPPQNMQTSRVTIQSTFHWHPSKHLPSPFSVVFFFLKPFFDPDTFSWFSG
jgi:hypothetical protein